MKTIFYIQDKTNSKKCYSFDKLNELLDDKISDDDIGKTFVRFPYSSVMNGFIYNKKNDYLITQKVIDFTRDEDEISIFLERVN